MELLSVAMLIVISTFALDFIHSDRSIFKIVDLDEAWSFYKWHKEKLYLCDWFEQDVPWMQGSISLLKTRTIY